MTLLAGNPFPNPFGEQIAVINPAWLYVPTTEMVIPVPGGDPVEQDQFWLYVPIAKVVCNVTGT